MQPSRLHGLLPVRRDVVGVICKPGSVLPPSQPEAPAATNSRCRTASLPCQMPASLFHQRSDSACQGNTTCSQRQPNGSAFIHCFLTCSPTRIVRTSCHISTMLTYTFRLRIFMLSIKLFSTTTPAAKAGDRQLTDLFFYCLYVLVSSLLSKALDQELNQ